MASKNNFKLLTRDQFREGTFERDKHKCLFCDRTDNLDAHHIIERRLFSTCLGYHISNGASLCPDHHIAAEMTTLSCEDIREKAGIQKIVIPEDMYADHQYTKWGDVILLDGRRMPGPLFYDESVQKILNKGDVLSLYTKYVKYPRTLHLPCSPGATSDDKMLTESQLDAYYCGVTVGYFEKLDGENSSLYNDHLHARSLDSRHHPSRDWLKRYHSEFAHDIPDNWRVCGENNMCLSWEDTLIWFEILGIQPVPLVTDIDCLGNSTFHKQLGESLVAQGKYGSNTIPNFGMFSIIGLDQLLHYICLIGTYYFFTTY